MRKKKVLLVFTIINFVVAFLSLSMILVFSITSSPIKNNDTISLNGTIKDVKTITDAKTESYNYEIQIEEYDCKFKIFSTKMLQNESEFKKLIAGNVVKFKIKKDDENVLQKSNSFIEFVSLEFEDMELISLYSYNQFYLDSYRSMTTIASVVSTVFLLLGIFCNNYYFKYKISD